MCYDDAQYNEVINININKNRATVIDFWKGKLELVSMDDELPVVIFLIV